MKDTFSDFLSSLRDISDSEWIFDSAPGTWRDTRVRLSAKAGETRVETMRIISNLASESEFSRILAEMTEDIKRSTQQAEKGS